MAKKDKKVNFDVIETPIEDGTVIMTSNKEISEKLVSEALARFDPTNKQSSAYLTFGTNNTLTADSITELTLSPQTNLANTLTINSYVRNYINANDIIGKTYESVESNVNTELKLDYISFEQNRNKNKTLDKAKMLINAFNEQINVEKFIKNIYSHHLC